STTLPAAEGRRVVDTRLGFPGKPLNLNPRPRWLRPRGLAAIANSSEPPGSPTRRPVDPLARLPQSPHAAHILELRAHPYRAPAPTAPPPRPCPRAEPPAPLLRR